MTSVLSGATAVVLFAGPGQLERVLVFLAGMAAAGLVATLLAGRAMAIALPSTSWEDPGTEPPGRRLRAVPDTR